MAESFDEMISRLEASLGDRLRPSIVTSTPVQSRAPAPISTPAPVNTLTARGSDTGVATTGTTTGLTARGSDTGVATHGTTTGTTTGAPSEYGVLRELLSYFGLDSLYDTVRGFVTEESTDAEINLVLRKTPEYQQRFRAIFEREKQGLPPISAAEVVDYERDLGQIFQFYGYPQNPGENLQDVAAELMINDVSDVEVQERLTAQMSFARQVLDDPENDGRAQQLLGLGATLFDVANYALDPTNTLDQVQRRLTAAAIANEANQARYGGDFGLRADEALELSRAGLTAQQAQEQFGLMAGKTQVVDRIVGDSSDPITREQELAAISGDVEAQAAIERQGQKRVAAFQVGGNFATDEEGFGGLR